MSLTLVAALDRRSRLCARVLGHRHRGGATGHHEPRLLEIALPGFSGVHDQRRACSRHPSSRPAADSTPTSIWSRTGISGCNAPRRRIFSMLAPRPPITTRPAGRPVPGTPTIVIRRKAGRTRRCCGHKWLARYRAIDAASAQALRVADERIAASAYEAGRDGLLAALRIDPGNPMLLNRLAACLRQVGDPRTALAAMRRACDVDRRDVRTVGPACAAQPRMRRACGSGTIACIRALAGDGCRGSRLAWRPLPWRWSSS